MALYVHKHIHWDYRKKNVSFEFREMVGDGREDLTPVQKVKWLNSMILSVFFLLKFISLTCNEEL